MKRKIALIVALVVITGLCFGASAHSYKSYEKKVDAKNANNNAALADARNQVKDLTAAQDTMVKKYNVLWDQCQGGYQAYTLLTASTKATLKAPVCGLAITE